MVKRIIIAAALALSATPAFATSILYGSDNDNIYTVDTATGTATLVGSNGLGGFDADGFGSIIRDLTSSSTQLYGAQWNASQTGITGAIATINRMTGAVISSVALTGLLETGGNRGLYSIAFDTATNTLFGNTGTRLYSIDPVTGAATFIGLLPANGRVVGLGIDASTGNLYAINNGSDASGNPTFDFHWLDKSNASILSTFGLANPCSCDVAFDPLTSQGYISSNIQDASGNILYGGLDRLNADLSGTSFVGQHGAAAQFGLNGLAFFGGAVPEPSTWMMMIAGFGLAGVALRRSKRAEARAASA